MARSNGLALCAAGAWTARFAPRLERIVADAEKLAGSRTNIFIDVSQVSKLDTFGAWLIERLRRSLTQGGVEAKIAGLSVNYASLVDEVRRVKDVPIAEPIWPHAGSVALVVEVVAVLVCIGAGLAAWRTWRRSRDAPKGREPHPIEPNDGRVRYLAAVGLICSGLFLFSTLFTAALFFMVRPCNG